MLGHINHLKSLHDELKEWAPEDYKHLTTALDAVGEDSMSFEKVKGTLLNDAGRNMDTPVKKS